MRDPYIHPHINIAKVGSKTLQKSEVDRIPHTSIIPEYIPRIVDILLKEFLASLKAVLIEGSNR